MDSYLAPLAATPSLASVIEYGARIAAIGRHGIDKVVSRANPQAQAAAEQSAKK